MLGRAQQVYRIGTGLFTDFQQLVTDLVDRLIPGHLFPFTINQFHRVFQTAFPVAVFAHRCTLGTMRAQVEGIIERRFLSGPDTVLYFSDDAATD